MKKKTRRALKNAAKTLGQGIAALGAPGSAALGALSVGGLVAAVASDPEVRQRARALAHATLDRAIDLMMREPARADGPEHDEELESEDSGYSAASGPGHAH
jgi:hypothetical protein